MSPQGIRPLAAILAALCLLAAVPSWSDTGSAFAAKLQLKSVSFDPLTETPAIPTRLSLATEPTSGYFVVQFRDKIRPGMIEQLRDSGATDLEYIPDQGYLVRVAQGKLDAVRGLPQVRWIGAVQPAWKLSSDLGLRSFEDPSRREGGLLLATIELFEGEQLAPLAQQIEAGGVSVRATHSYRDMRRLTVQATLEQLEQIARLPSVYWIEEEPEMTMRNNVAPWVVQSDVNGSTPIWDRGLHGEDQIIGVIDSRLDMNSCYFEDPANNTPGPNHRKVVAYRSNSGLGAASHGTHVAGTMAGNQFELTGSSNGDGHAYNARLSHTNSSDISGSNLYSNLSSAHNDGARVHGNSWGDDGTTSYTNWCRDIDRFSYDNEDSLVLFAVTNLSNLRSPENAKNVLAVGASQNGTSADSFCSGGVGPTVDGRRKPEIFAPGCGIQSARNNSGCSTQSQSGTSMACPAVTANAALVRQYFEQGWYPSGIATTGDEITPSGALVKAILLNSTVDMANISGFPSNQEGWGRLLLDNALYFDGDIRRLVMLADVRNSDGLTTGQQATYSFLNSDTLLPLRVTLNYTEPAAAAFANPATINNLDLEVSSPSGEIYRGNVLSGGASVVGGSFDAGNNVEMVLIDAPEAGEWTVRILGTQINQGSQGYALVTTGLVTGSGGTLRYLDHTLQDSAMGNGDGRVDPGETITIPVDLRNQLSNAENSASSRLTTTMSEMLQISTPQAFYPEIAINGSATSLPPHHRMTVAPDTPCGTVIPLTVTAEHPGGTSETLIDIEIGLDRLNRPALDLPKSIPINGAIQSAAINSTPATVDSVTVQLELDHAAIGELTVRLISPQGTQVMLHDQSGGNFDDIDGIYGVNLTVDGPGTLADFVGEDAQGNWTLVVQDRVSGATIAGELVSWAVEITPVGAPLCAPMSCPGDPLPGEVGPTFSVTLENGDDLRWTWPSVAGASGYRLWRATQRDFSDAQILTISSGTTELGVDAALDPPAYYYRVRAFNSCEWQGP